MKMASRDWLVGAYRQRINDVNEMLDNLNNSLDRQLLNSKLGGILTDPNFINKQGKFRSIASKLNKSELELSINILDDVLSHQQHVYETSKELSELARRLGVDESEANRLLALMEYAQAKVKEGVLSSYQVRDIVKSRMRSGQSVSDIKTAIDTAIHSAQSDPELLFTYFSENGRYIEDDDVLY